MRLRVVWPGKTRNAQLRALVDDYFQRLCHFVPCEISELREHSNKSAKTGIDKESKRISDGLRPGTVAVLLDTEGSEWSSPELAARIQRWENAGTKEVAFIVGGPGGVSAELSARVDNRWSLSRLTLPHEVARVLLLEQLYRAYTINHGLPYQK